MSLERDIEDEVRFHLEMRTRANLQKGMSPEEARLDAERRFGDPEKVRRAGRMYLRGLGSGSGSPVSPSKAIRERRTMWERLLSLASSLRQDLVVGIRMLIHHPFLTGAAVLSLGLGIGAGIGLIVSLAFARALRGIVFGVNTADPMVFAGAVSAMLLTAVAAGWLPAHRAARVDPTEALRAE